MQRAIIGLTATVMVLLAGCVTRPVAGNHPPHLDRIEVRAAQGRYDYYYPTFYFTDADGDVTMVHRRLVAAEGRHDHFNPTSRINIDPAVQKHGAAWVGGIGCGPNPRSLTIEAYLTDRRGHRSNSVTYTVVCHGAAPIVP